MKTLSVKLPDALYAKLQSLAECQDVGKSELVRNAIEALASKNGVAQGSFLDLARDLIGSLAGPADLSYNDRYLRGYGKR